jgi:hypothetical protein
MHLLTKEPFDYFVAQFKELPWKLREEILSDYNQKSEISRLRALYSDLMKDVVDADDWKSLYKSLKAIDPDFQ